MSGYKLTIGEETYEISQGETDITDLDEDMDRVASQIAHWGRVLGLSIAEEEMADALYRQWRARFGEDLNNADPKLSEWKVKQSIEASEHFTRYKQAIAATKGNRASLEKLLKALEEKSQIMRSKGANRRAEMEATGLHTRGSSHEGPTSAAAAKKRKRLQEINLEKKKKRAS